jgi:PAT family beta-lactamase induction signal transducer AmpG
MTGSTSTEQPIRRHPAAWVPTLYFAEGIPFYVVNILALLFYQNMGIKNAVTTAVISMLALPWTLKPLWSPMLEMYKTKKFFVVGTEMIGGLSLALLVLSLNMPDFFRYTVAMFVAIGFCSATHDIAADGVYIASLTSKEQAAYIGWQGAFYNLARVFSMGALPWLVGFFTDRFARAHAAAPVVHAWMVAFGLVGLVLVALSVYHVRMLPTGGEERKTESVAQMAGTFGDVVASFFKKPHIFLLLIFILLYRCGEGQVAKVGPLFLRAARATGGLGISSTDFGKIYSIVAWGVLLGGIAAGYFCARLSLKRAITWLLLVLAMPLFSFVFLSYALPVHNPGSLTFSEYILVGACLAVEQFGYGFGSVGVILLMMQEIAPGKYQTSHYAFANSLMNLSFIAAGAVSGWVQSMLGYQHFFIWTVFCALPALILSRFIPFHGGEQAQPSLIADAQC